MRLGIICVGALALSATAVSGVLAASSGKTVTMNKIDKSGVTSNSVGTVEIRSGSEGVVFAVDLKDLPPGEHGFHIHQNADCGPGPNDQGEVMPGMAAGGHWDPEGTKKHTGPEGQGHLGDLPALKVSQDGTAKAELKAPRIKDVSRLEGRALMIHAGGDNYADEPKPLGGGGARIACGTIR